MNAHASKLSILALLLAGCTASNVALAPPSGDEVTIFVPGYRGSFLVTEGPSPERAWISVGDMLTTGERSLALPFPGQKVGISFGPLRPDGPLTGFTALPLLIQRDIYRSWLEFGRDSLPGFIAFPYDWRHDIRQTASDLCAFIDALAAERNGNLKVNLIGHSMGGLIALHCLRRGTSAGGPVTWEGARYVKRAVFVGTPFGGGPGIFDDLFVGTPMGLNRELLSPEALFTFPSAYQLLPPRSDFFAGRDGKPVQLDVFDAQLWIQRGWGVFQKPELRSEPAYRAQLQRQLDAHRALWEALGEQEGPAPELEALAVVGTGRSSVRAVRVEGDRFDFEHPVVGDGDGSVLAAFAQPPQPMRVQRVETSAEHMALMGAHDVQQAIARFLSQAR